MATNKPTHTPGPWTIGAIWNSLGKAILAKSGQVIAHVRIDGEGTEENQANARLIAAAPELLAALKGVAGDEISMRGYTEEFRAQIRATIAKAEGK